MIAPQTWQLGASPRSNNSHWTVSPAFKPVTGADRLDAVCARYGLQRPFILYVGTIEPRKNLVRLIKAFALLKEVPSTGRIRFHCGHDHSRPTPEHIGYVPQKLRIDMNLPMTAAFKKVVAKPTSSGDPKDYE